MKYEYEARNEELGILVQVWKTDAGHYRARLYDLDAEELVGLKEYKGDQALNRALAEADCWAR